MDKCCEGSGDYGPNRPPHQGTAAEAFNSMRLSKADGSGTQEILMSKVLLTALLLMSTSLMAEDLVPVGLQKQLLVDDYVIAEKHNITRVLGKVKKVGIVSKPTLESDFHPKWKKPDGSRVGLDYGYYTSVAYNDKEKTFQMWYMGGVQGRFHSPKAGTGYAESKDGLTWTKPSIREDHKDNVVHLSQGYSCSVDPTLAWGHPEKYKAAFDDNMDRPCQAGIAYSADGISWTAYNKGKPVTHRAADTQNQIMWDSIAKRYCLLTRTDLGGVRHGHGDAYVWPVTSRTNRLGTYVVCMVGGHGPRGKSAWLVAIGQGDNQHGCWP